MRAQPPTISNMKRYSSSLREDDELKSDDAATKKYLRDSRRSSVSSREKPLPHARASSPNGRSQTLGSPAQTGNSQLEARSNVSDKVGSPHPARTSWIGTDAEVQSTNFSPKVPQSPSKTHSSLDLASELAAQARQERKILDLEISNSSLLAINRTLEREMRKQSAELRRLRRSTVFPRLPSAGSDSGVITRESEQSSAEIGDSSSDSDSNDQSSHSRLSSTMPSSPGSSRGRTSSARFHDPVQKPLDLAAHRSLLSDIQKLNQSIDRCLGCTNGMLVAGREALEHQKFHFLDAELGPKVLSSSDEGQDSVVEHGKGLLSPVINSKYDLSPWEHAATQSEDHAMAAKLDSLTQTLGSMHEQHSPSDHDSLAIINIKPETPPSVLASQNRGKFEGPAVIGKRVPNSPLPLEKDERVRDHVSSSLEEVSEIESDAAFNSKHGDTIAEPRSASLAVQNIDRSPSPKADKLQPLSPNLPPLPEPPDDIDDFTASLDGLDDDEEDGTSRAADWPTSEASGPKARTMPAPKTPPPSPPKRPESWQSPRSLANINAAANTPGNRSSFKSFGNFLGLESLSLFGRANGAAPASGV